MLKPTVIAIPIFALLIAIEAFFVIREAQEYDKKDAWNNVLIGFVSIAFGAAFGVIQFFLYELIYNSAPFQMPLNAVWAWILLVFIDDFAYYWFHRISHEMRFMWNFHVVHHSSNQYNLSVAVRQSWFGGIAHWIFYVPIALLGFPFWAFVLVHGLNLVYQFWIHTKVIKKLGWLEYVFNTPSHHRVHHGVNDQYLDKNYAGIFIIWDRFFGTFTEETEEVRYGITTPLKSYNSVWINTHSWFETFQAARKKKTMRGKMRCFFGSPDMNFIESDYKKNSLTRQVAE